MASSKEYLDFILEQLSEMEDITYRKMMGEYILYYKGRIFGGIYDDRFLIKPVKTAVAMIANPIYESPYDGAKDMILIENIDDRIFLADLINAMYDDLPEKKKK